MPADANLETANYVLRWPRQLVVTWDRARLTSYGAAVWQRHGVAIWQLVGDRAAVWRRVFTRESAVDNESGVDGYAVTVGDASGDGRAEVLVLFAIDGSAGGGTYHLYASDGDRLREAFVKRLSQDEGTFSFDHHALLVREGVDGYFTTAHCCFAKVRERRLRWDGQRMVVVRDVTRANRRGWPPG